MSMGQTRRVFGVQGMPGAFNMTLEIFSHHFGTLFFYKDWGTFPNIPGVYLRAGSTT